MKTFYHKKKSDKYPKRNNIDYIICFKDQNNIEWGVPMNNSNTDYQEYLKWLEEGNTPLPAEEVGLQPTADEISK